MKIFGVPLGDSGLYYIATNIQFQDGGSIILTASTAASKETEAFSVYSATKAAIRSFARTWTVVIDFGIRFRTIWCGYHIWYAAFLDNLTPRSRICVLDA